MDDRQTTNEMPEAEQTEVTGYGVECPSCGEWHEEQTSFAGKVVDCICGTPFRVKKLRYPGPATTGRVRIANGSRLMR